MNPLSRKRGWFWIAIAAIVIVLLALLVPHSADGHSQLDWVALLPAIFVGLIVPLKLLPLIPVHSLGRTPEFPLLASSFQRPPPRFA